jgi:hypothetical protein
MAVSETEKKMHAASCSRPFGWRICALMQSSTAGTDGA